MPISDLLQRQRAMARIGNIRIGEVRTNQAGREYPATRETYRFTCPSEPASALLREEFGGEVRPWEGHPGEYEVLSQRSQIPVIIDLERSFEETFSRYDGKTQTHKCNGITCRYVELKRDGRKKITSCEDKGEVLCMCGPAFAQAVLDADGDYDDLPEPTQDKERACDVVTKLWCIIPATRDVLLWQYTSKGYIFNSEVKAAFDTLRAMPGMRYLSCLLTMCPMSRTVGEEVTKWTVVRLSMDPKPPDFIALLQRNQAMGAPALDRNAAKSLPERGNGHAALPRASELPLPPGFAATRDQARELCQEFYKEQGWDKADAFVSQKKLVGEKCAVLGLYWPAMVLVAKEAGKAETFPSLLAFLDSYKPAEDAEAVIDGVLVDPLAEESK